MINNTTYEILNSENKFVDFLGIIKQEKQKGYHIKLENGMEIKCSQDHIFLVNDMNVHANSMGANISYLSTIDGDSLVTSIEELEGDFELYDIVDAESGYSYITNGIYSHNCSFLGSGDNFIAEEHLKRIDEEEVKVPLRQEYEDLNMWVWEDPEDGVDYVLPVDVSSGHGDDNSSINILKVDEKIENRTFTKNGVTKKKKIKRNVMEQVGEYYAKIKPEKLAIIVYEYAKRYNNAYVIVDVTNGYGAIVIEKLMELGYTNFHYSEVANKPTRDRLNGYVKTSTKTLSDGTLAKIDLIPGFFIGNNRGSVLIEFQRSINMKDLIIRSKRALNELKTFVTVTGSRVADHKRSFHDDSIIGIALGVFITNHDMTRLSNGIEKTKKMLDAFLRVGSNDVVVEEEKEEPKKNNIQNPVKGEVENNNTSYRVGRRNPYGEHAWLMKGLKR